MSRFHCRTEIDPKKQLRCARVKRLLRGNLWHAMHFGDVNKERKDSTVKHMALIFYGIFQLSINRFISPFHALSRNPIHAQSSYDGDDDDDTSSDL